MGEQSEICRAARDAVTRGDPLWLATVMRVRGSAYRHPGARLLFSNGQVLAGSVSGGCLEASIVRKAPWLTRERPACVHFEGGRAEDDEGKARGTGCDGSVDILIERVLPDAPAAPLAFLDYCSSSEQRGALFTVFESSDSALPIGGRFTLAQDGKLCSSIPTRSIAADLARHAARALGETEARSRAIHGDGFEALLEIVEPAPHLFVFGSGPDAVPLVEFAQTLGLGVTICDTTARVSVRQRFPRATLHVGSARSALPSIEARRRPLAVVMSHHYPTDSEALEALLGSRALYIGMLGPARRTARMLAEISAGQSGLRDRDRARVRAPVGLDLGAETPAQIALSIVAEIQAVLAHGSAQPLSCRRARPIHAPDSSPTSASASERARAGSR